LCRAHTGSTGSRRLPKSWNSERTPSSRQTDVTDAGQVKTLVDRAVEDHGCIDLILNNAGLMPHSPLERGKIEDWDRMIDVNLKGVPYGIAAPPPHMTRQKSGHGPPHSLTVWRLRLLAFLIDGCRAAYRLWASAAIASSAARTPLS